VPKIPFDCSVCSHRWPGHDANCVALDHPAICPKCQGLLYVALSGIVRHMHGEEPFCPTVSKETPA